MKRVAGYKGWSAVLVVVTVVLGGCPPTQPSPEVPSRGEPPDASASARTATDAGVPVDATSAADHEAPEDAGGEADACGPPPEPIHAIHPEQWLDASESTARPIRQAPPGKCIRGGCPFRPAPIPLCPPKQPFVDIESYDHLACLMGVETVLRGWLSELLERELTACSRPCCHKFQPGEHLLVFRSRPRPDLTGIRVVLTDPDFPFAFGCAGDDETYCCGLATGIEVLVSGRLSPWVSPESRALKIDRPRLCRARKEKP